MPHRFTRRATDRCHAWALAVVVATLALVPGSATEPRFLPDDPLLVDPDTLDTPVQPVVVELSDLYDRFGHIFATPGSSESVEALNTNTLDEVPDSTWFTNRHGVRRMSISELVRGPNTNDGPDMTRPWRIFRTKTQGITPGLEIRDGRGDRYIVKFDPVDWPGLSSTAEIISTKIFYALGYHTPQNHLVRLSPRSLAIEPGTTVEDEFGSERTLTPELLRDLLRRVPREADGTIRVVASRYLDGVPIGPFRYYGTRRDDPNDIIPHEHRRELRGLRVFAAWLNHDDTRAHNTQDAWVEEDGRRFVRHHLLDFGSTLGSGSVEAQLPWLGYHYWLDPDLVIRNLRTFGFVTPTYHKVDFRTFPAVGRIEGDSYDPGAWFNDYPNPAFVRMTRRDAFWAAKIMLRFTPEELAAVVATADFTDPEAEAYLLDVIVQRQRKTGRHYLLQMNPLDGFTLRDGRLRFENLAETHGLVGSGTRYTAAWHVYDNVTGETRQLTAPTTLAGPVAELPAPPPSAGPQAFLMAEIASAHADHPAWATPVQIFLRPSAAGWELVGIDRTGGRTTVDRRG